MHLKKIRGYRVEETSPGIYTVNGDILPIQVIDSRRLSADENLWLKSLSNRLDPLAVLKISEEATRQDKVARLRAFMDAIAKANFHAIEGAMNMSNAARSLDEVFERTGLAARWEARGKAMGKESEALAIAKNMVSSGFPLETVVSMTKLDPEKVKELYQASEDS